MLAGNIASWFEIPAPDLERAAGFYESVLGVRLQRESMGPMQMAIFPSAPSQGGGCLASAPGFRPSDEGATIYLNLTQDLSVPLERVKPAGGRVLVGKTALPGEMGYYAQFVDSEGNRVGLFSPD
jgi:predicted enzyme related to lactoylglutathione lyase